MELLKQMEHLVRQAGEIVLSAHDINSCTQLKTSAADMVTAYDVRVEAFLKAELPKLVKDAIFYGEEETENTDPRRGWAFVVDPIDGTANFVHGLRHSAISVALARDGVVEYAVIFDPYKQEMFTAKRGCGAFCNGQPIHVSQQPLNRGVFAIGSSPYYPELREKTLTLLQKLFVLGSDFRRMGSAALDLCDVACGRLDAYFECLLSPWDYAAGSLLVQEAGGFVSTLEGTPLVIHEKCSVWASNQVNRSILHTCL